MAEGKGAEMEQVTNMSAEPGQQARDADAKGASAAIAGAKPANVLLEPVGRFATDLEGA